mmetsp:Transcript_75405/g.140670  ORF Transcript_75405/g.140670 Transcript_75405/m.140670 type:complete len:345 (-) Transcript_75405:174-1208(-)
MAVDTRQESAMRQWQRQPRLRRVVGVTCGGLALFLLYRASFRLVSVVLHVFHNDNLPMELAKGLALGVGAAFTASVLTACLEVQKGRSHSRRQYWGKYFKMALPSQLMKYPLFELVASALACQRMPEGRFFTDDQWRGLLTGCIYCIVMLPMANVSLLTILGRSPQTWFRTPLASLSIAYTGFWPALWRDMTYGFVRAAAMEATERHFCYGSAIRAGRDPFAFGTAALVATVFAAPFNELRGWWLQKESKHKPLVEFVDLHRVLRSMTVGASIQGLSLCCGKFVSIHAARIVSGIAKEVVRGYIGWLSASCLLALYLFGRYWDTSRQSQQVRTEGSDRHVNPQG